MDYSKLDKYLPEGSLGYIIQLLEPHKVMIRITRTAKSRYGSFYINRRTKVQHITVSGVLNPYSFLITFIHEIAHMKAFGLYGRKIKPHGNEWKNVFTNILSPVLQDGILPDELTQELSRHMRNPSATVTDDVILFKCLRKYDKEEKTTVSIEELQEGAMFYWNSRGAFIKGEKLRKRYRCTEQKTKKIYLFNPIAEVTPVNNP
jgi:SprT protein